MQRRVLYSNNGTITDLSSSLNNYRSSTSTIAGFAYAEDYFYLGTRLPCNHAYIKMGSTVNAVSSVMTVATWDGDYWRDAVELIDETSSSGKSLAQSGYVTWVPDRDYSWPRESTNYSGDSITGLTTVEIYDLHWTRFAFSANLTANIILSWVGQLFSADADMYAEHAHLMDSSLIGAVESGKTTWEEQHVRAADIMVQDLIGMDSIKDRHQILEREDLKIASTYKVAELIYRMRGDDYNDQAERELLRYKDRLLNSFPKIDLNVSGAEEVNERFPNQGRLYR